MKRAITMGFGLLALAGMTLPTSAADLGRPIGKAPPVVAPPVVTWTGFYIGVGLGGRWDENTWTTTCLQPITFNPTCTPPESVFPVNFATSNPTVFEPSGFRVSGYAGFNWQFTSWVVGIEGDWGWADNSASVFGIPGTIFPGTLALTQDVASVNDKWDASLRGRIGFLVTPTALFYATGGVAFLEKEVTATCTADQFSWCVAPNAATASDTLVGWTVGGGIEWMFSPNWLFRAEYRYADYGSADFQFFATSPIDSFNFSVEATSHIAYAGIAYKF
jgi:outer membrane immunogenic protein